MADEQQPAAQPQQPVQAPQMNKTTVSSTIKNYGPTGDGNPPVETKVGPVPKYVEPKKEEHKPNPLNDLNYLENRLKAIDGKDVRDDKK